jgi:hypothetical protein
VWEGQRKEGETHLFSAVICLQRVGAGPQRSEKRHSGLVKNYLFPLVQQAKIGVHASASCIFAGLGIGLRW